MKKKVIILGAGLSGLYTAVLLKSQGYLVQVLEARKRLGGRIYTQYAELETPIEMGATWFGAKHTHLLALLQKMGIEYYKQHTEGTAYFEPFSLAPPQKINIPEQVPSYRIDGGSEAIIKALASKLSEEEIQLGTTVSALNFATEKVSVSSSSHTWEADLVVSTLPPALLCLSIAINPALDLEVKNIALATHTWMQDSIKTALVYETPFWRDKDVSGTFFSNVGPVTEFYDHSDRAVEKYALCGFVNGGYAGINAVQRKEKVLAQLERFFGEVVHTYLDYVEYVWPQDPYTKHEAMPNIFPHQNNGHSIFERALMDGKLFLSGSETARNFPGYMDGAVQSAERVVNDLKTIHSLV